MQLDYLLKSFPGISRSVDSFNQSVIMGISTDPKLCQSAYLYLAAESEIVDSTQYGLRLDGRDFIRLALQNGAVAILTTAEVKLPDDYSARAVLLAHEDPMSVLGPLCARFFEKQPRNIALVTGTNGKTSSVNFSRMFWSQAGFPACSIGNLGGVCSDGTMVWPRDRTLSVPDTVTLHKVLRTLFDRGVDHVAMEATSHALYDRRVTGVNATVGAFTNLTRDHLDFHGTMEEYFRVKMTLFTEVLTPGSTAVMNADDSWCVKGSEMCKSLGHKLMRFGKNGEEIRLLACNDDANGQNLKLEVLGRKYNCRTNLRGYFQVQNILTSLGIVISSGVSVEQAINQIENLTEVEGRLNFVANTPSGGSIVVDFAHTPDGIRAALEGCRSFTKGRLISVFGCDGERDQGKRPQMGEMAARLAELVIVTDGDPRSEDPAFIRREVLAGIPKEQDSHEIADRSAAIAFAVKELKAGDTLLVTGRFPMLDAEIASKAVESLKEQILTENLS